MGQMRNGRVLIVDDDPVVLKSLRKMLEMNDYSVDCADEGPCALEMIERNGYDVILSEINMREMNGFELLKRRRRQALPRPSSL